MSVYRSYYLSACLLLLTSVPVIGGVNKEIQTSYIQEYKNRAMFLKIPVHGLRQTVFIGAQPVLDRSNMGEPLAFQVGAQVRITDVNFKDDFIRFKLAAVDFSKQAELLFQFSLPLTQDFSNRDAFERGLSFTFTQGSSYREIDTAKETFITGQFDRLIEQFSETTGTTPDYVIKTISEQNPEFQKMREDAAAKDAEIATVRQAVEKEVAKRREAESQSARLRREFDDMESRLSNLKAEQAALTTERDKSQRQIRQLGSEVEDLKEKQQRYETQIRQLMSNLNVESSNKAELDQQVKSLGSVVDDLKAEKNLLAQKFEESTKQNEKLQQNIEELTGNIQQLEKDRNRLSSNLRALTSDKNSLNSRYLTLVEEKEALETADRLAEALELRSVSATPDRRVSELFLLSSKIGTLEIQPPTAAGTKASVTLSLNSPDTVKFSEEERTLHEALGKKVQAKTGWLSQNPELSIQLTGGEEMQEIAPRESASWDWDFGGSISEPTTVSLLVQFEDAKHQFIRLQTQDFIVAPSGMAGLLNRMFSIWYVFIGFALGIGLAVAATVLRRRPQQAKQPIRKPHYISEKEL